MSSFQNDENSYLVGSATHEVFQGWNNIKKGVQKMYESQGKTIIKRDETIQNLQIHKDVAWYVSELDNVVELSKNSRLELTLRITGVLRKTDNGWKIVQRHASAAQAGIQKGDTWPTADGLLKDIEKWIAEFDLNPNFKEKINRSALLNYLIKAKEVIENQ